MGRKYYSRKHDTEQLVSVLIAGPEDGVITGKRERWLSWSFDIQGDGGKTDHNELRRLQDRMNCRAVG